MESIYRNIVISYLKRKYLRRRGCSFIYKIRLVSPMGVVHPLKTRQNIVFAVIIPIIRIKETDSEVVSLTLGFRLLFEKCIEV